MLLLLPASLEETGAGGKNFNDHMKSPQPQSRTKSLEQQSLKIQIPESDASTSSEPAKPALKRTNSVNVLQDLAERYTIASAEMMKNIEERFDQEEDPEARLYLEKFRSAKAAQSGLPRKFSFRVMNPEGDKDSAPDCISPAGDSPKKFNYRKDPRKQA